MYPRSSYILLIDIETKFKNIINEITPKLKKRKIRNFITTVSYLFLEELGSAPQPFYNASRYLKNFKIFFLTQASVSNVALFLRYVYLFYRTLYCRRCIFLPKKKENYKRLFAEM